MPSTTRRGTIVVTGAAGGIGGSIARYLGTTGYRVVAADIDPGGLARLNGEGPDDTFLTRRLDVADERAVGELFSDPHVSDDLAGVVLCAGITRRASLMDSTSDDARMLVQTNLLGTHFGLQAAAKALGDRSGSLIVITSINAIRALPTQAIYSATKAATQSMISSAAVELGPRGIRVNAIAPGAILTEMNADLRAEDPLADRIPLRRIGRPEDLNGAVGFLLGEESAYITGATLVIDGGLIHLR